jgi:pilus assembly protein CpaE
LKIALISPNTKGLNTLRAMLERSQPAQAIVCHEGGISKLRTVAEQGQPDVIIVEGLYHEAGELAPVEFVTTHYPQVIIIMVCSQQHTSDFLINAMRVGVREVLPSPVTQLALDAAISRAESKLGRRAAPRSGRIFAFLSCKGGSGGTFLATNLGHQLGAIGKKVLLIDLNLQLGEAVMTVHDHKATSDIATVARNLTRLDSSLLKASVVQITPDYEILAAPDDPGQSLEVKPAHLDAILNLAVNLYDYIILDLSKTLDDLAIKALDRANKVFLVVQAMLPYIRNAKTMMTVFHSLGYSADKVEVVVNRFWKKGDIDLDDLRSALLTNNLRVVPNDYREVARAVNQGMPLASIAKSSPVLKAISDWTQSLVPRPEPKAEQAPAGGLGRFLKHN